MKVLNTSAKETKDALNQINTFAKTAKAVVFKASKEEIDVIFAKMDTVLDVAKASLNQALKPSQSIKEGCELIITIIDDLAVPKSASGAEILDTVITSSEEEEGGVVVPLAGEEVPSDS